MYGCNRKSCTDLFCCCLPLLTFSCISWSSMTEACISSQKHNSAKNGVSWFLLPYYCPSVQHDECPDRNTDSNKRFSFANVVRDALIPETDCWFKRYFISSVPLTLSLTSKKTEQREKCTFQTVRKPKRSGVRAEILHFLFSQKEVGLWMWLDEVRNFPRRFYKLFLLTLTCLCRHIIYCQIVLCSYDGEQRWWRGYKWPSHSAA